MNKETVVFEYDEKADEFRRAVNPVSPTKVLVARRVWAPVARRISDELVWRVVQFTVMGFGAVVLYIIASIISWFVRRLM